MLLAVVCALIGVATEFALQRFLMHQLDQQVIEAGRRSAVIFELGPPPPPGFGPPRGMPGMPEMPGPPFGPPPPDHPRRIIIREDDGPGPEFLNAPGQAARMVGAVIAQGVPVDAGVITADGARAGLSSAATTQLAQIAPSRHPTTIDLDGLGSYRVVGNHSRGPEETIVVGLPTSDVDDTLLWVLVMFCIVGVIALVAAATAGMLVIRRQFRPLSTVSAAARQVADLELDRGEVRLPSPIVKVDPAGAHTEIGQLGSALNRMVDRIAGALSARYASEMRVRQFVADASHELRTPLAAIRGYTELAQRKQDALPDDVAHAMSRVESETERMTRLVEDMLLLARLDTGRPLEREQVDLTRLVVDTASDAHIAGPEHRVVAGPAGRADRGEGRRGTPASGARQPARQRAHPHAGGHVGHDRAGGRRGSCRPHRDRRRTGNPGLVAARSLPAVRARRLLALTARGQHRTRPGDSRGRRQGASRHHRRAQHPR